MGDEEAQQGIRFNLFQLFSTYYGEDERLNIGPKGFTGEKYGGATYWDTEAYMVPMYLSVAEPKVTRQLLRYRHQQLPGAFHNATPAGAERRFVSDGDVHRGRMPQRMGNNLRGNPPQRSDCACHL